MPKVDLHTHSTFSDGLLTLPQLVALAKRHSIKLLGLADHDTFVGASEFNRLCLKYNITPLPGVEVGTNFAGRDFHLLLYNPQQNLKTFFNFLKTQQQKRHKKALQVVDKLEKAGFFFSPRDKHLLFTQPTVGKPQISRAVLRHSANLNLLKTKYNFIPGYSFSPFIRKFLEEPGQPGYVPKAKTNTLLAIKLALKTNARSVLAHPDLDLPDRATAEKIIKIFCQNGLWGLEMPHVHLKERQFYRQLAKKLHLQPTYGSDTHDKKRLGVKISQKEYNQLLKHL
jgi:hypothetical protein